MPIFVGMKEQLLYKYIKDSGKTQVKIASIMGVSPQQLNWMIKNPKKLKAEEIELLALAINRSPRNLFSLIINN